MEFPRQPLLDLQRRELIPLPTIGIDYTAAYEQGGGIGRYVRELVTALARHDHSSDYRLFVSGANKSNLPPLPGDNFSWRSTPITPTWLARIWHRAQIPLYIEQFTGKIDLYHATDFTLPPTHARSLLTVHDLSFARVPEATDPKLKAYLDVVVPRSVRRADHVLADSQATKDDLIALYNTPAEKITVLLSGVDARFHRVKSATVRAKYKIPDRPYIFAVGGFHPRKNYVKLMHAVMMLRAKGIEIDLVIVGGKGSLDQTGWRMLNETMPDYIHLRGFADDADLPALYSEALITAMPSLYEGFGLPLLESMACGTPVLTSNISSLPEVVGDAGILIDPNDQDAITAALERLITDSALHAECSRRGLEQIKTFTWDSAAAQLHATYQHMLS